MLFQKLSVRFKKEAIGITSFILISTLGLAASSSTAQAAIPCTVGAFSDLHLYDRVEHRDEGDSHKPWQRKIAGV